MFWTVMVTAALAGAADVAPARSAAPALLTLEAARARAREAHPAVLAARTGARAAHARAGAAGAWDDPMVGAQIYQLPLDNFEGALQPGRSAQERAMTLARGPGMIPVMVMASQTFPWPGKRGAESDEAKALAAQQDAGVESVRQDVDRAVAYAYLDVVATERSRAIVLRNASLLDVAVAAADARLVTGVGRQAEALAARNEKDGLQRDLIDLDQQAQVARARLASLLGLASAEALPALAEQCVLTDAPARDKVLEAALRSRPELRGAEAAVQAAVARARRARLAVFPDVTASASYMAVADGPGMAVMTMNPVKSVLGPPDMVSVGISVPLPVFAPWKQNRQADAASLDQQRARQEVEARVRLVETEVEEALLAMDAAHRHVDLHNGQLIPLAQQSMNAAQTAYVSGQADMQSLLEAERMLRGHHLEAEAFLQRFGRAAADLERASGMKVLRLEPRETDGHDHHGGTP